MAEVLWINPLRDGRERLIKINSFLLEKGTKQGGNVQRAKLFLITDLIKFTHGMANCIFHKERTASMHYYPDGNRVYCYGCNKAGDAIDVYMQLYNCTFKEAINKLST